MVVMLFKLKNKSSGFTLLEILLVIGIIAILAGIVIVAINPSKQLATVRNTQRKSDLKQIYNAITQYYIDNSAFPPTISTTTLNEVCNTGAVSNTSTSTSGANCATAGLANLSVLVPTYLTAIPTDPTGTSSLLSFIPTAYAATTATGTGYKVGVNTAKQVLISAPLAELGVRVVVGNVPTVAAADPTLVAHYLMNDNAASTVVIDSSSYAQNAAMVSQNTSARTVAGWISPGSALSFQTTEYALTSAAPVITALSSQNYSISMWMKRTVSNVHFETFTVVGHPFNTSYYNKDVGQMLWYVDDIGTVAVTTMTAGTWYHFVFVKDGSNHIIYKNGVSVGTASSAAYYTATGLKFGGAGTNYANTRNVDDVRIYSKALSSTEIAALYNIGAGTEAE
jgi:prepilin-type N-terminal cleavage/methylation domain-containing protein